MRVLKRAGMVIAVVLAVLGAVTFVARFADGPLGPFPGGAMSGELVSDAAPDWSGVGDTIELQIRPEHPWSLHTYAIPYRGELFVPSFFASRRRWVPVALADPRVVVRVGRHLYERRLERVDAPALRAGLMEVMATRHGYARDGVIARDTTWYFRLAPRITVGDAR